jgi:spore germination cell wall hydrolase CwlJ-like protein
MRRCYRNVALVLGAILFTSNAFSNSSSFTALEVYAAEDTMDSDFMIQSGIESGEENVETEIPADESEPAPTEVEAEDYKENNELTIKEYNVLLRIVEAEAGGEGIIGKMLVANVIMNRVNSSRFPDTVTEVVYQKNHNGRAQFSPTVDGRMESVKVTLETEIAVLRALCGEDSSNGALYFRSKRINSAWHDRALERVLVHGNHIFYTI